MIRYFWGLVGSCGRDDRGERLTLATQRIGHEHTSKGIDYAILFLG
jgi:hypothetical protein